MWRRPGIASNHVDSRCFAHTFHVSPANALSPDPSVAPEPPPARGLMGSCARTFRVSSPECILQSRLMLFFGNACLARGFRPHRAQHGGTGTRPVGASTHRNSLQHNVYGVPGEEIKCPLTTSLDTNPWHISDRHGLCTFLRMILKNIHRPIMGRTRVNFLENHSQEYSHESTHA